MTRRRRERPLTREELLDAALAIVDTESLAALTMHHLADAVGVEAMSLYHHVPSKAVLLDLLVDRIRSEMRLPDPAPDDWADALEAVFVEYLRVLTAHPNLLPLSARRTDRAGTSGLEYLIDHGLHPDDAVELYQSLVALTVGYAMLSSPLVETVWAGLPEELAERLRHWSVGAFRRTLRIVMHGYRAEKGDARS